jgi:Sulfotransferase domain
MPRTGSLSMKAAYETLGLRTYHGFEFIENTSHQIEWGKAIDAKFYGKGTLYMKEDFDRFLGEYAVLSDFPFLFFWDDFVEWYPDVSDA